MKKKKIIRYVLLSLIIVIAAAALYIYKEYNRTHKDTARLKADYTVSAASFVQEFEKNEKGSNEKYWDKVVEVEGMVKDLSKDDKGFLSVVLGDTSSMSSVRCSVDSSHTSEANLLKKGDKVTVKGICTGFNADELLGSDVILVRSVIDQKNNN